MASGLVFSLALLARYPVSLQYHNNLALVAVSPFCFTLWLHPHPWLLGPPHPLHCSKQPRTLLKHGKMTCSRCSIMQKIVFRMWSGTFSMAHRSLRVVRRRRSGDTKVRTVAFISSSRSFDCTSGRCASASIARVIAVEVVSVAARSKRLRDRDFQHTMVRPWNEGAYDMWPIMSSSDIISGPEAMFCCTAYQSVSGTTHSDEHKQGLLT